MTDKALDNSTLPDAILDQAFHWSVVLEDTAATTEDQQGFEAWLQANSLHQIAWQRVQVVEAEFSAARSAAGTGSQLLQKLAKQRQSKHRGKLASLLSLALLIGLTSILWRNPWQGDYVTGVGEQQQITLQGGSELYLNSQTALDISYTANGPQLHLHRGQILIDSATAAISDKPHVITSDARFTPVGTRFVITKLSNSSELSVIKGKVEAHAGDNRAIAQANETLRVSNGNISPQHNGLSPDAWVDKMIEANNARLGDVLDALARHRYGWLYYDDSVADLRVHGVFHIDDTDKALSSLANSLPIKVQRATGLLVRVTAQ